MKKIVTSTDEANKLSEEEGWDIIDIKCFLVNTTTALHFPKGYDFNKNDLYTGGIEKRVFIILEKPATKN